MRRLLSEAMNTPLPTRPKPAMLPSSFRASMHPPPFFDSLTRSTLPTASLSPPLSVQHHPSDKIQPPPIVLLHSPPIHNSVDALRSVHTRSFSTLNEIDSASTSSLSFSRWWFQSDNFFSQEQTLDHKEHVKKKCSLPSLFFIFIPSSSLPHPDLSPRNPVIFCHGLLGFDSVTIGPAIAPLEVSHWRGIKEVLEENGTEVLITRVPATSSPVDRAKVLEQKISSVYPGRSVHLIGTFLLSSSVRPSHLFTRRS